MSTLAQLIDLVQLELDDSAATYYTDALVTAAIRDALDDVDRSAPAYGEANLTTIADQYDYDLTDVDPDLIQVYEVLYGDDEPQTQYPGWYFYHAAGVPTLYFRTIITDSTITFRYTLRHTISGLDSASGTSLLTDQEKEFVNAAAAYSLKMRATSRTESVTLQQNVAEMLIKQADERMTRWQRVLRDWSRRYAPKQTDNLTPIWNDEWHNFGE